MVSVLSGLLALLPVKLQESTQTPLRVHLGLTDDGPCSPRLSVHVCVTKAIGAHYMAVPVGVRHSAFGGLDALQCTVYN